MWRGSAPARCDRPGTTGLVRMASLGRSGHGRGQVGLHRPPCRGFGEEQGGAYQRLRVRQPHVVPRCAQVLYHAGQRVDAGGGSRVQSGQVDQKQPAGTGRRPVRQAPQHAPVGAGQCPGEGRDRPSPPGRRTVHTGEDRSRRLRCHGQPPMTGFATGRRCPQCRTPRRRRAVRLRFSVACPPRRPCRTLRTPAADSGHWHRWHTSPDAARNAGAALHRRSQPPTRGVRRPPAPGAGRPGPAGLSARRGR